MTADLNGQLQYNDSCITHFKSCLRRQLTYSKWPYVGVWLYCSAFRLRYSVRCIFKHWFIVPGFLMNIHLGVSDRVKGHIFGTNILQTERCMFVIICLVFARVTVMCNKLLSVYSSSESSGKIWTSCSFTSIHWKLIRSTMTSDITFNALLPHV